jgi:hypothetical protein
MKTINKRFILILLCIVFKINAFSQNSNAPIILLNKTMLSHIELNVNLTKSFDITQNGDILLSTQNRFYLLQWEELLPLEPAYEKPINSFAYTPDNDLIIISENKLYLLDRFNQFVELFKLPNKDMGLYVGDSIIYVYDNAINKQSKYGIYMLNKDSEKYEKLIEFSTLISSVVEDQNKIYFSSENKIYVIDMENKKLDVLINLPQKKGKVISITVNPKDNILYFSTTDAIYCVKDGKAWCMIKEFGGIIQYFHNQLFVFDPENKFLMFLETQNYE